MLQKSFLDQQIKSSPLSNQTTLGSKKSNFKRPVVATLVLTSLVDAFSILVIYLLINASSATEVTTPDKIQLPMASQSEIALSGLVVQVKDHQLFVDGRSISRNDLLKRLVDFKTLSPEQKKTGLIIQADRSANFAQLSPIITMAANSGVEKLKFAVIQGERK